MPTTGHLTFSALEVDSATTLNNFLNTSFANNIGEFVMSESQLADSTLQGDVIQEGDDMMYQRVTDKEAQQRNLT